MTPQELTLILDNIVLQLSQIMSIGIGSLVGMAFVITATRRWF